MNPGYLTPYFEQQHAPQIGYDPETGLAVVQGFAPAVPMALRAGAQRIRNNMILRRQYGHTLRGDGFDDDGDELGAEDFDELDELDEEIGAIDDDDDDELGASPRKTRRQLKRAQKTKKRIERRLDRVPAWRKRKRRKLNDRLEKVNDKIATLRADLRQQQGGGGAAPRAASPAETLEASGMPGAVRGYDTARPSVGVSLAAPNGGGPVELPIEFTGGSNLFEATVAATTAAGTQVAFAGETLPKTYLDLQVRGVKFVAWLNAPLMNDGGGTPLDLAIVEQSAQLAIILQNATVDGGLNMYPDDQVMNLGGKFGASSERVFQGQRLNDVIFANGKCNVSGVIELPFLAAQEFEFSMRAAVICDIISDRRVRR